MEDQNNSVNPSLPPLQLLQTADRGVGNRERVILRANNYCQAQEYFLSLGISRGQGTLDPINDNQFWLGRAIFKPGDIVIVYTGRGTPNIHHMPNQTTFIYTYFWGRTDVLFGSNEIFPYLYQILPPQVDPEVYTNTAIFSALMNAFESDQN